MIVKPSVMIILGIETSCDETGAAVLQKQGNRIQILSNILASSASIQAKYGGIIPEQAAREQIKAIIPVIEESLQVSEYRVQDISAVAVTYGPGLIGSLLVGVETAKTLTLVWNKPLIPVNHLIGHFYANWIEAEPPKFPCLGLLVSGGHTDLVLFTAHGKYKYLGGTRDDAAGECFDKCARLLGLPYPGGPAIAQSAMKFKIKSSKFKRGSSSKIELPRPLIGKETLDFSFSGLKTAVLREVERLKETQQFNNTTIQQLSFEVQEAITDVLVEKTIAAAKKYKVNQIMIAGGVAANKTLVNRLQDTVDSLKIKLHVPPPSLCTDNGAMIAAAGFWGKPIKNPTKLQADPNLSLRP